MQAVLVMFRSDGDRRSFSLTRDITVIGRREDCDLRIPLGEVSRKHCRLIRDGETLRLEDLGSSNGTFHNGQRVQEVMLQPGDSIQVGPVVFVLQVDGVPADEELAPVLAPTAVEAGAGAEEQDARTIHSAPRAAAAAHGDQEDQPIDPLSDDDAAFAALLEEETAPGPVQELNPEALE